MAEDINKQERTFGMFCHLGAFAGYLFPFGNIIAPLILWLVKKEEMPFVEDQGKESLNFQISVTIYFLVSALLYIVAIGLVLMLALAVFDIVMVIIATVKASNGVKYRYPLTIRFIK